MMLTSYLIEHRRLENDLARLNALAYLGRAEDAFLARLDSMLPPESISTHEAAKKRELPGRDGIIIVYDENLTPYTKAIDDACDEPGVEVVAVSGPGRCGKTSSAENHAFKRWRYGPFGNMLYYMQSEDDLADYLEERGEFIVEHHAEIAEKVTRDRRMSRTRKRINEYLQSWLPATTKTTVGKAAPFIVADEIDAYNKKIRASIMTRLRNRQREFGSEALLYAASHPDAGEDDGITSIIAQGIRHLWWWQCPHCDKPSSPCQKAKVRMGWNVSQLLAQCEDMDKDELLAFIEEHATLICPHCQEPITNEQRLRMSLETGRWLQPHQEMMDDGEIDGARRVNKIMGFVIHAFMSPFVRIGELAKEFVAAKMTADETGNDTDLREVTSKSLGEYFEGAKPEEILEEWSVVKARLGAAAGVYQRGVVPRGVRFLTAFADTQGYGWEVRVVGWGANLESWLIDAFAIRQWQDIPGVETHQFRNLQPEKRMADWGMLEFGALDRMYPLEYPIDGRMGWYLPIGKLMVDDNGMPGVSNMARVWLSHLRAGGTTVSGKPFSAYRVQLVVGSAHEGGELYGKPKQILFDEDGKRLPVPVSILAHDVTTIKKMIAARQKIETPGPGMMHLPADLPDTYVKELVAERYVNDTWLRRGRNETFDGWVAAESARWWLLPDRVIWDPSNPDYALPEWAEPVELSPTGQVIEGRSPRPISQWERFARMNAGFEEDDDNGGPVL